MIRKFYSGESTTLDFNTLNQKIESKVVVIDPATPTTDGLMSKSDKSKLDGVANGANNYVHPSNHPASVITQDANNRFVTDAEKSTWNGKATTSSVTEAKNRADAAYTKAEEAFQSASNGKQLMASAITGMGVEASNTESFQQLSDKVRQIKTKAVFS